MSDQECRIIAITGSPGSGKTSFTLSLGEMLAHSRKRTVCISPDTVCPALAYWLPDMCPTPGRSKSLGALMQFSSIDLEAIARCLIPHPVYSNLALMGLEFGTYPGMYDLDNKGNVQTILSLLRREVDFILVDCNTDIPSDAMSHVALASADAVIRMLTPDCKGLAWAEMTRSEGLDLSDSLTILSPVFRQSPVSAVRDRLRCEDAVQLPFSEELPIRLSCGDPLQDFEKQAGKYYEKTVKGICSGLLSGTKEE